MARRSRSRRKGSRRKGKGKGRSKARRRHGSKKSRGNGLFKPPRHKWIAEIVTFESPGKAERAARRLVNIVKTAPRGKALTVLRALNYAANRAEASAQRSNLSAKERSELIRVSRIYREATEKASEIYHERFD